jgi:hypothetical protein
MSSLQIGLAVAGGLVLAGVVAHGAWVSRKNLPRQALPEPKPSPATHDGDTQPGGLDPVFDAGSFAIPHPEKKPNLDALIDVIAPLTLELPVSGDAALAAMPTTRRAGSKPYAIEGQNAQTQRWEAPVPGQRYIAFQAGVQLANRSGALNDIEYSEFVIKTQTFADALQATPEFPEMRDEVARGRELDHFASDHDAQLSFTLRAINAAWSPGYVTQHATRLGFTPGVLPGRMVLPASTAGTPPVLGLAFDTQAALADDPAQSALREVTLSLDVPQVDRAERPFVRLRETAMSLAASMDAIITDDNGLELPTDAMDLIGSELETLYDTLQAHEFSAGSILARRLFS